MNLQSDGDIPRLNRIHFTGQSLGGGLAQYAAYDFAVAMANDDKVLNPADVTLTTFNSFGGVRGLQILSGSDGRREETLTARGIARRWQRVNAYASDLANDHDDDARRGAVYRFNEQGLLESGAFGGGFGFTGSTGMARGIASLRALQGLDEGFQRLRS